MSVSEGYRLFAPSTFVFPEVEQPIGWIMYRVEPKWWGVVIGDRGHWEKRPLWAPARYYVWSR